MEERGPATQGRSESAVAQVAGLVESTPVWPASAAGQPMSVPRCNCRLSPSPAHGGTNGANRCGRCRGGELRSHAIVPLLQRAQAQVAACEYQSR